MKRLTKAREALNLNQSELAKLAGTSQPQIARLERGERKLTMDWAERLAPHLGITPKELLFGGQAEVEQPVMAIRVEGTAKAGAFMDISLVNDDEHEREIIHAPLDPRFRHARRYALSLDGDSMNKRYMEGSKVICAEWAETGLELKPGMRVHVERHEGSLVEVTVKQYAERDGKRWLDPQSTNPKHTPIELNGNEATEIVVKGLVLGSWLPETF